jgi:uncharacterized protein (UPF0216 family)
MKEKQELTYEMIMQMFAETRNQMKETDARLEKMFAETREQIRELAADRKETDKQIKELAADRKETDKKNKEISDDVWKSIKAMNKHIGGITKSLGEMAEETIYNVLEKDMTFCNVKFYDIDRRRKRKNKSLNLESEFDIILENGDTLAIIEVKNKVKSENVSEFATTKLEIFRKLFPIYKNYKIILGIGGVTFENDAIEEAKKNGIGIIKAIGDKVEYYTDGIKIY